jgi:hypothetical protein
MQAVVYACSGNHSFIGETRMTFNPSNVDESKAGLIIHQLLAEQTDEQLSYRVSSQMDYELLFGAARLGLFPDLLSITRKGLRLRKLLVHSPPALAAAN